jgi:hypothetical protein
MLNQVLGVLWIGSIGCSVSRMMPMRRKFPLVCQLSKLLPAFCLFGFSLPLLAQGEWASPNHIGLVQDWSTHHAVFPRTGPLSAMLAAQHDPRAFYSWRVAALDAMRTTSTPAVQAEIDVDQHHAAHRRAANRDWSITLGGAGTAQAMYPAKFTFDINATPSCANDFVVFPVNQSPNATHENLVAFNNLYSGNVNSFGICNRTTSASDNGLAATVRWSYAVSSSIAAGVSTSPALSLDGSKVAFVESKGGSQPHFHVLAWKSGDGVNASNKQDTQSPKILSTFTTFAPAAGSGTATDLAFGVSGAGSGDTLSSPFVDYGADKAYIGDDKGHLVRLKNVFCTINVACTGATPPAPSIDTTWGTAGTVTVACASKLTGPVVDFLTGNVFVGCSDGKLYGFNTSGTALASSPVAVGDGSGNGGIVDPPIVDGVNGFVYAFTGNGGGDTSEDVVQTKTNLSSARRATLGGQKGGIDLHAGSFNDAYFSSLTFANWLLYVCSLNGGGAHTFLWGIGFDSSRNMNTGTPLNQLNVHSAAVECSPLTEFLNGATDRLFLGLNSGVVDMFNITSGFPAAATQTATESGGTSGIVVDNVSTQNQASSIYFVTLANTACAAPVGSPNGRCATKLTQSGLN